MLYNFLSQVAWHLLALLAVIAWTGITTILVLLPLLLCGKLRITDADENTGMDVKKIKEQSYHGSHSGGSYCHNKSTVNPMSTIIVPGNKKKSLISGSVNAARAESSFDGAVSFPLPSPSAAPTPPSSMHLSELYTKPPFLPCNIPPVDSLPLDIEEVTIQTNTLYVI